jgi:DNA-binding NarL/FixJ family response regulator
MRVAIVDDVREARTLIRVVVSNQDGALVVAEAADIDEASLACIVDSYPDVIVIDRRLPSGDGASVVGLLRALGHGAPKVVVYSIGDPSPAPLLEVPDAYVLIDDDIKVLAEAIARVAEGTPSPRSRLTRRLSDVARRSVRRSSLRGHGRASQ